MRPPVWLRRLAHQVAYPFLRVALSLLPGRRHGAKCLLSEGAQVLLVRHTYGDRRRWDLPGGFIGRHEAPEAAVRRELREELGVELSGELRELAELELCIHGRRDMVHYFHAELGGARLRPNRAELRELDWFAPELLPAPLGLHVPYVVACALASRAPSTGESAGAERAPQGADPQT